MPATAPHRTPPPAPDRDAGWELWAQWIEEMNRVQTPDPDGGDAAEDVAARAKELGVADPFAGQ